MNPAQTREAVQEALQEVEHALRPEKRTPRGLLSWLVALAAGAAFAWRSYQAGQKAIRNVSTAVTADEEAKLQHTLALSESRRVTENTDHTDAGPSSSRSAISFPVSDKRREEDSRSLSVSSVKSVPSVIQTDSEGRESKESAVEADEQKIKGMAGLGKELWGRINRDNGMTWAAALAFAGVFSIIPMLLFLLAVMGFVIKDPRQVAGYVDLFVKQMLPGAQGARAASEIIAKTGIIQSAQGLMHGKWWSVLFGLLSLFVSALGLFVTATGPINAAWEVKETRNFIKLRLLALGVFVGAAVLFILSLVPSAGPDAVQHLHLPWLGLPKHPPFLIAALTQIVFEGIAVVIDVALFTLIYRFLPNTQVTWKDALAGGIFAGVFWEVFKKAFAVYLAHFGNYNKLYGAMGSAVLLVTWIYYSCILLVVGATVCRMYREHTKEGGVQRKAA
ncbi:MAG TPA: YihY/virulence factor BrkB family protein [Chthonomonadaceae bacterium]|nr:YihY/virulence factor BrkB family protein [Chthonomonadaceae bacterium]